MIQNFRHRGLKLLYEKDNQKYLRADQVGKIKRILARLDEAVKPADMDLSGYRLHPLGHNRKGCWGVNVTGNWRVTFRFKEGHACDVNLEDYH